MKKPHSPPAHARSAPKPHPRDDAPHPSPHDQPSVVDRQRDKRLADELAANAEGTVAVRHRDGDTAIENEEDGVPEDENQIDEAVSKEDEVRRSDKRLSRSRE